LEAVVCFIAAAGEGWVSEWSHLWDLNPGPALYEGNGEQTQEQTDKEVIEVTSTVLPLGLPESDLQKIIEVWTKVPEAVRVGILAMVQAYAK